ncbi:MAG: hypothetical protein LBQ68_09465 [Clostridiales bacterium]|nr:hypothetical protein [Clostridiales bacterium]
MFAAVPSAEVKGFRRISSISKRKSVGFIDLDKAQIKRNLQEYVDCLPSTIPRNPGMKELYYDNAVFGLHVSKQLAKQLKMFCDGKGYDPRIEMYLYHEHKTAMADRMKILHIAYGIDHLIVFDFGTSFYECAAEVRQEAEKAKNLLC